MAIYGGIEAGGTKFVCVVAGGPDDIRMETRFPTTYPDETLKRAVHFFKDEASQLPIEALGIASFGPVDLEHSSSTYGFITTTPKPGWANTDIAGRLKNALKLPVAFDTDVNAAAFSEYLWGASRGLDTSIYFTIGTGIGAGVIVAGKPVHGLVHPETGHILVPHDLRLDPFPGICPYHGDCFEGLACGKAIQARWGQPAEELPDDHPAWDLEANYIALALTSQIYSLSPKRIVLGGGVMQHIELFPRIRQKVQTFLNNYIKSSAITERIDSYIVPPGLGNRAGVMGAIALAQDL